jgi:ComF family protein
MDRPRHQGQYESKEQTEPDPARADINRRAPAKRTERNKTQMRWFGNNAHNPGPGLAGHFMNMILPPLCVHCHTPLREYDLLCPKCWVQVNFITRPLCDVTGLPLPYNAAASLNDDTAEPAISPAALAHPPAWDRARAAALFGPVVRSLIHGLKYGDRRDALKLLGGWMNLAGRDLLAEADLLMPIPLHRSRLWRRRFNQSALLAREIAKASGLPLDLFSLERTRPTRSQIGLTRNQRKRNVAGAFAVPAQRRELVASRKIILVDDVLTSGATANGCARALKKAGAERVFVLALARAGLEEPPEIWQW